MSITNRLSDAYAELVSIIWAITNDPDINEYTHPLINKVNHAAELTREAWKDSIELGMDSEESDG